MYYIRLFLYDIINVSFQFSVTVQSVLVTIRTVLVLSSQLVMKKNSSTILTLPLIQEEQLSVTGERMGTNNW